MKTLLNIWLDDQGVINAQTDYHFGPGFTRADLKDWEDGRYRELARFLQAKDSTDLRRVVMLLNDARTDPRLDYQNLHPELESSLIDWRRTKAREKGVPAFMILSQKTLLSLADAAPSSYSELVKVPGIGYGLADSYGEELLRITGDYFIHHGEDAG